MVTQRKRAEHAAQLAYDRDNGGSDPVSPDFWDEDAAETAMNEIGTDQRYRPPTTPQVVAGPSSFQTPVRATVRPSDEHMHFTPIDETSCNQDEELWAMEAARAEEAEREAEEAEMARQFEESQQPSSPAQSSRQQPISDADIDMDMDWEMESD